MWCEVRDPAVEVSGLDRGDAVVELYRTRRQGMVRLAYVLTRDPAVADDLVQEAFIAVHRNWDRVERPGPYLRTAVVNACRSHHRHLRVVRDVPAYRPRMVETPTPFDHELQEALERLPFDQRAVLALRYFEDLDDIEIATVLGVRRATVRSRAHRALAQLRKETTR